MMRPNFFIFLLFSLNSFAENSLEIKDIEVKQLKESPLGESSLIFNHIGVEKPITYDSGELLNYFLGVNPIQNGGFSTLPSIQGLSDDRIKIKVDGMDLISSCANHMNAPLSYTVPSNIESMSIVAGLSSVSQGGDNIGGVIKINSFTPFFDDLESWLYSQKAETFYNKNLDLLGSGWLLNNQVQTFYKSNNDTVGANFTSTAASSNTVIRYFGSGVEGNNYYAGSSFKEAGAAATDRGYLDGDEVGSTEFKNTNHQLNISKKLDNHIYEAQISYHYSPYEGFANQRMDAVENENFQGKLSLDSEFVWGKTKFLTYFDDTHHEHNFGPDKQFMYDSGRGMRMMADGQTFGLNLDSEIYLNDESTLKVGIEYQYYRLDDKFPATAGSSMMQPNAFINVNNGRRDRFDVYAQIDQIWSEEWLTSMGLRYGLVMMDADNVSGYASTDIMSSYQNRDSTNFNSADRSQHDHNFDVSLLSKYTPSDQTTFEFGYTMKSRSPNLYQRYTWSTWTMTSNMNNLYGDGNGYVGNINLDTETAHKVGFLLSHEAQNRAWSFKFNPYYSYIHDYIDVESQTTTRTDGFRLLKFYNHDAYIYGVDVMANSRLFENDSLGSFTSLSKINYQRGRNQDNDTNLYNLMPLNLTVALNHHVGSWTNTLSLLAVDKKDKVDDVRLERTTPGYVVLDYKTSYNLESLTLDFGIDNLFDKKYDNPVGGEYLGQGATMSTAITKSSGTQVPGMGRSFNFALKYEF
jgi:iron complex outermembrane receptor protein